MNDLGQGRAMQQVWRPGRIAQFWGASVSDEILSNTQTVLDGGEKLTPECLGDFDRSGVFSESGESLGAELAKAPDCALHVLHLARRLRRKR
jgi:hypothetical protein